MKAEPATAIFSTNIDLPRSRWLAVFLAVSGLLALIYEVVWQRQFALVFGSAAPATTMVLSAYFAGIGLGAWWVGNRAERWKRPLRAYAWLELLIGVGAILVAPMLRSFDYIYPALDRIVAGHRELLFIVRASGAWLSLLLPTFCMGGTLPLLGPVIDQGRRHLGQHAGWLYFVNTAGASVGALAVPFLLLPHFGLLHTVWGCSAINAVLAGCAWFLDTRENVAPTSAFSARAISETKSRGKETAWQTTRLNTGLLAFVSGFATFALQVLWNRAFAQLHENSMYSFSVIVAVTIAALAVGAQFARVGLKRVLMPLRLLSVAWIFGGAAIVGSPWLFIHFSHGFAYLTTGAGWAAEASRLVALAGGLLLVPMALVGIGFPVLMECVGGDEVVSSARSLGRICTVNVVGSIVGSLVSGFLLPRWLGLWNSMIGLGIILIAIGVIEFAGNRQRRPYLIFTYVVIGMAVVFLVGISGLDLPRVSVETAANERLVAISEGPHGITAVVERPGSRRLKLNNHYGLGGTASTGDERMQAHIPLLLHPSPHRVAFLGLGTGITAGGALFHPVDQVTVIELVPDVISAARIYFHDANQGVIDNDRTHMIADDARHALRNGAARYDVIVGDLVVPWREGEGSLFTLEQFQAARTALAPNGIFCQWLPLFQLSETEANIIFRTFLQVFPHAQVWRGDFSPSEPAIALIGSNADMRLDAENIRRRISQMRADPTNPQMESPEDFWMNFIGELDATKLDGNELRLNLDDQPWVEILGPLRHTGASDGKVFTGRALQKWERALTQSSQAQLNTLPPTQAAAVRAGDTLAEMTLCLYEQNTAGAKAAQSKLREELPEPAFRRLF